MNRRRLHRREHAQSLVEYALILVLVAVVAIVVIGLAGLAIQRVMGVAAGALGAKHDTTHVLEVTEATCLVRTHASEGYPDGLTGVQMYGLRTEPTEDLYYSTNLSVNEDWMGHPIELNTNGENGFQLHVVMAK